MLDIDTARTTSAVDGLEAGGVTNQQISARHTGVGRAVKVLQGATSLTFDKEWKRNPNEDEGNFLHFYIFVKDLSL